MYTSAQSEWVRIAMAKMWKEYTPLGDGEYNEWKCTWSDASYYVASHADNVYETVININFYDYGYNKVQQSFRRFR